VKEEWKIDQIVAVMYCERVK